MARTRRVGLATAAVVSAGLWLALASALLIGASRAAAAPGAGDGGSGQIVIEWGARPATSRPVPHSRPVLRPRPRPAPAAASRRPGTPGHDSLPLTGFPFVQVGIVAVVLIGLGVAVTWAGGRRPEG